MDEVRATIDHLLATGLVVANPPKGAGTPCCVFVAELVRRVYDLEELPEFYPGGDWWQEVNLWVGQPELAPVPAYARVTSNGESYTRLKPEGLAIVCASAPGYYIVQGWRHRASGHQFLVQSLIDGTFNVIESTKARGLEINLEAWGSNTSNERLTFPGLRRYLEDFERSIGAVPLLNLAKHFPTPKEATMAGIVIPKEVSEELLQEAKDAGVATLDSALDKLAEANEDGKLNADDAKSVARAIFDELVDGVAVLSDTLLVLPEPYEAMSDLGIEAAKAAVKAESGLLDDLSDAVRDFFDGPEEEEILEKLIRWAGAAHFEGKASAKRKERKHAWRLAKHFPETAATLGIVGNSKSDLKLGYTVQREDGTGLYSLVPPLG